MVKRFCDLCGEEITYWDKTKWKIKYFYDKSLTNKKGWCSIDAHEVCLRAVAKEARLHGMKMKEWNRKKK